jgi:hypothetical protein
MVDVHSRYLVGNPSSFLPLALFPHLFEFQLGAIRQSRERSLRAQVIRLLCELPSRILGKRNVVGRTHQLVSCHHARSRISVPPPESDSSSPLQAARRSFHSGDSADNWIFLVDVAGLEPAAPCLQRRQQKSNKCCIWYRLHKIQRSQPPLELDRSWINGLA